MEKKKDPELRYVLTLTEDQARTAARACELYCRLLLGQLDELNHELLLRETRDDISGRREAAMTLLLHLKKLYFPDLHGHGHSYGVGHDITAERSWSVYQALRHCMAWHEHPEGGIGVSFDPPMSYNDEPLPQCEASHMKERTATND